MGYHPPPAESIDMTSMYQDSVVKQDAGIKGSVNRPAPPSVSTNAAVRYHQLTHPHYRDATNVFLKHSVGDFPAAQFSQYGLGTVLYFTWLKQMSIMFVLLSLATVPALVLNTSGQSLKDEFFIEKTTLGNYGSIGSNSTTMDVTLFTQEYTIDLKLGCLIETLCDVLYCVMYLLACLYLVISSHYTINNYHSTTVTVAQYSIEVRGFSHKCFNRQKLQTFFEQRFGSVVDVSIHSNDIEIVQMYQERARLKKQLLESELMEKHLHDYDELQSCKDRIHSLYEKVQQYTNEIQAAKSLHSPHHSAVVAYVTFNTESSVHACLRAYPDNWLARLFMEQHLRIDNYRIRVLPAPEPSNINFENLSYSNQGVFFRRLISVLVTAVSLLVTTVLLAVVSYYQSKIPAPESCTDHTATYTLASAANIDANNSGQVACFCSSLSSSELLTAYSLCQTYISSYVWSKGLILASAVTVMVINALQYTMVKQLVRYEKHLSQSGEQRAIASKLFIGLFINTAIIILLVNANLKQYVGDWKILMAGDYNDFVPAWYKTVGLSILLTHVLVVIDPMAFPMVKYSLHRLRRYLRINNVTKQEQMNALFKGPEFRLSERYSTLLAMIYVAFFFSAGIPLLMPITALIFIATYWIDKYTFLRFYRIPPRYDESLHELSLLTMPGALIFHSALAMWYYSSPVTSSYLLQWKEVTQTIDGIENQNDIFHVVERLQQWNVLPMFILLVCVCGLYLARTLFNVIFFCRTNRRLAAALEKGEQQEQSETQQQRGYHRYAPTRPALMYTVAKLKYRFESYHLHNHADYSSAYMVTVSKLQMQPELSLSIHVREQPVSAVIKVKQLDVPTVATEQIVSARKKPAQHVLKLSVEEPRSPFAPMTNSDSYQAEPQTHEPPPPAYSTVATPTVATVRVELATLHQQLAKQRPAASGFAMSELRVSHVNSDRYVGAISARPSHVLDESRTEISHAPTANFGQSIDEYDQSVVMHERTRHMHRHNRAASDVMSTISMVSVDESTIGGGWHPAAQSPTLQASLQLPRGSYGDSPVVANQRLHHRLASSPETGHSQTSKQRTKTTVERESSRLVEHRRSEMGHIEARVHVQQRRESARTSGTIDPIGEHRASYTADSMSTMSAANKSPAAEPQPEPSRNTYSPPTRPSQHHHSVSQPAPSPTSPARDLPASQPMVSSWRKRSIQQPTLSIAVDGDGDTILTKQCTSCSSFFPTESSLQLLCANCSERMASSDT